MRKIATIKTASLPTEVDTQVKACISELSTVGVWGIQVYFSEAAKEIYFCTAPITSKDGKRLEYLQRIIGKNFPNFETTGGIRVAIHDLPSTTQGLQLLGKTQQAASGTTANADDGLRALPDQDQSLSVKPTTPPDRGAPAGDFMRQSSDKTAGMTLTLATNQIKDAINSAQWVVDASKGMNPEQTASLQRFISAGRKTLAMLQSY